MMNSYDSKEKFKLFELSSHYLRVDENHPLELLIGLNDSGRKTLRFIGEFERTKVQNTKIIEVNHYKHKNLFILSFSLLDDEYIDLFYLFCNDIIDNTRNINQEDGYVYLVNRFEKWRTFLGRGKSFLSESEIKGLIGELLFLRNEMFPKYGISKSILGWTGPEPTKKDFSYYEAWYEVKVVTNEFVTINSIDQLDSNEIGYLVIYNLEKMSSEANGTSLNKITREILEKIELDQDRATFIMKLADVGYYLEDYYDSFVYHVFDMSIYKVSDDFPRLTKNSLPKAIAKCKYDIIIKMIESYKVK